MFPEYLWKYSPNWDGRLLLERVNRSLKDELGIIVLCDYWNTGLFYYVYCTT